MHVRLGEATAETTGPSLPSQRTGDAFVPAEPDPPAARILVIDPEHRHAQALADNLPAGLSVTAVTSIGQAATVPVGDLALVSLHFGSATGEIVGALHDDGWQRVLVLVARAAHVHTESLLARGATGLVAIEDRDSSPARPRGFGPDLSDREIEVVTMVADGRPNKWIGEQLGLSSLTVKSHLARIGRKFGTGDRARIVHLALQAGVIQ